MELFLDNYGQLFAIIAVLLGLFGGGIKLKPYFQLAKEVIDVYAVYVKSMKNGVFTDEEKIHFANEILEAIDHVKSLKKKANG